MVYRRNYPQTFETVYKYLEDSIVIALTEKESKHLFLHRKAIVIDGGRVIEIGAPKKLISNQSSYLYSFIKETNKKDLDFVVEAANKNPQLNDQSNLITDITSRQLLKKSSQVSDFSPTYTLKRKLKKKLENSPDKEDMLKAYFREEEELDEFSPRISPSSPDVKSFQFYKGFSDRKELNLKKPFSNYQNSDNSSVFKINEHQSMDNIPTLTVIERKSSNISYQRSRFTLYDLSPKKNPKKETDSNENSFD